MLHRQEGVNPVRQDDSHALPKKSLSDHPPLAAYERGVAESILTIVYRTERLGEGGGELQDSAEDFGREIGNRGSLRAGGQRSEEEQRLLSRLTASILTCLVELRRAGVSQQSARGEW